MNNPEIVEQKKAKQTAKGTCRRSGRIRIAGLKAHIQINKPIKSFVSR